MLFLYLMPTMGIHVMVHLCGEKVSAISLGWKNNKCECETKKAKGNCCEDKVAFFKIKDEHQKIPANTFQVFKEKAVQFFAFIQFWCKMQISIKYKLIALEIMMDLDFPEKKLKKYSKKGNTKFMTN